VDTRARLLSWPPSQSLEDSVGTQEQDALDVSDSCAIDRERDDQVPYCLDASQVGVVADELAAAVFAQVTLFSLRGFAIFDDTH
jgi:hypothetical protein